MGWPSYVNDITERYSRDMEDLRHRSTLVHHEPELRKLKSDIERLLKKCEDTVARLNMTVESNLEYLTAPQFDVVNELEEAQKQINRLREENASCKHQLELDNEAFTNLLGKLQQQEDKLLQKRQELVKIKPEYERLKELESLYQETIYNAYSSPDKIRHHKRWR